MEFHSIPIPANSGYSPVDSAIALITYSSVASVSMVLSIAFKYPATDFVLIPLSVPRTFSVGITVDP